MQILLPSPNQPIGVGMEVRPQTDFIGPIQLGSTWELNIFPPAEGQAVAVGRRFSQLATPSLIVGQYQDDENDLHLRVESQLSTVAHGQPARLQVTLRDPIGAVLDTTTINVVYDAVTGTQWLTNQIEVPIQSGGFTQADRNVAADTNAAIKVPFLGVGGGVGSVLDIGQMFTSPPVEILRRAELLVLEGRGELRYPSGGTEVQSYGALVGLDHLPPGIGFRDGYVREYEVRLAQITVWGRHGNTLVYLKTLEDLAVVGQYLIWGGPFPRLIGYDVTPGVRLTWQWLILGVQP